MARPARFDAAWNRRRRLARLWRKVRVWLVILAVMGAALAWHLVGGNEPDWQLVETPFGVCGEARGSAGCVIDGDTLAIGRRRIRLTGYDAPELDGACAAEQRLAIEARDAVAAWLDAGPFEMTAADSAPRDRYGRELLAARRGSETLADHMIARGLAAETGWGAAPRDWCA